MKNLTIENAYNDLGCDRVLQSGIIVTDYIKSNISYRKNFLDYIYQANFKSQSDVINSGISGDFPIDGLDIGISGFFNKTKYDEWRTQYSHQTHDIETLDSAFEKMQQYADTNILNAWSNCKALQQADKNKGLQMFIEYDEENSNQIKLTAIYVPHNSLIDPYAVIKQVKIYGGSLHPNDKDAFASGTNIYDLESGGIVAIINRDQDMPPLDITLITEQETKTAHVKAINKPIIVSFNADKSQYIDGDTINISWTIIGADSVTINHQSVNVKGHISDTAEGNKTYSLLASNFAGQVEQELHIVSKKNPLEEWKTKMLQGANFYVDLDGPDCSIVLGGGDAVCQTKYRMWYLPEGSTYDPRHRLWVAEGPSKAAGNEIKQKGENSGGDINRNILSFWGVPLIFNGRGELFDENNHFIGHFSF